MLIGYRLFSLMFVFFFQAEDGIRDLVRSRGLGDVYKRQVLIIDKNPPELYGRRSGYILSADPQTFLFLRQYICLLYTSDAADDLLCVDLGGRRIIKKKK